LEQSDYEPLIAEWVEEVLKRKVNMTSQNFSYSSALVELILNSK